MFCVYWVANALGNTLVQPRNLNRDLLRFLGATKCPIRRVGEVIHDSDRPIGRNSVTCEIKIGSCSRKRPLPE